MEARYLDILRIGDLCILSSLINIATLLRRKLSSRTELLSNFGASMSIQRLIKFMFLVCTPKDKMSNGLQITDEFFKRSGLFKWDSNGSR